MFYSHSRFSKPPSRGNTNGQKATVALPPGVQSDHTVLGAEEASSGRQPGFIPRPPGSWRSYTIATGLTVGIGRALTTPRWSRSPRFCGRRRPWPGRRAFRNFVLRPSGTAVAEAVEDQTPPGVARRTKFAKTKTVVTDLRYCAQNSEYHSESGCPCPGNDN